MDNLKFTAGLNSHMRRLSSGFTWMSIFVLAFASLSGCAALPDEPNTRPSQRAVPPMLYVWKYVPTDLQQCKDGSINWDALFEIGNKGGSDALESKTSVELKWFTDGQSSSRTVEGRTVNRLSPGNTFQLEFSERIPKDCSAIQKVVRFTVEFKVAGKSENGEACCPQAYLVASNTVNWY